MTRWDEIRAKCPKLYMKLNCFECGPGWANLIEDWSVKIEQIIEKKQENPEIFAVQVKEKYGTLRFYMSCETEEIRDLIHEAEALSSQTCESCGDTAKMRGSSWLEVKCDTCFRRENDKK